MNSCLNCAHAAWARTSNGRINPHQVGRCDWSRVIQVPLSLNAKPTELRGGWISRKTPQEKCPVFHPLP